MEKTKYKRKNRVRLSIERIHAFKTRVHDAFHSSVCFGSTATEHIKRMNAIWADQNYQRLPNWAKAEIKGYESALWDSLYAPPIHHTKDNPMNAPLMSIQIGKDGRMFDNDEWLKESSEYKNAMECIHVWANHWNADKLRIWSD